MKNVEFPDSTINSYFNSFSISHIIVPPEWLMAQSYDEKCYI